MSRDDPPSPFHAAPRLLCDVTQSWSAVGGGVGTYLRRKRRHILDHTPHRHLLIVPGARDTLSVEGRAITATIASPKVPGSPNYRLLLRSGAVRRLLAEQRPDLIECQDAYNLPWAAIGHAANHPGTALVAAYCTDFPVVYVERPFSKFLGAPVGRAASRLCYAYCRALYSRFDMLYAMSENGGAAKLRDLGLDPRIVPLGVELGDFDPARRDPALRASLGVPDAAPLLVYAGRLDKEKKVETVVEAFRLLPRKLGAHLLLAGDGPLRDVIAGLVDPRIHLAGFVSDRRQLAAMLASSDLYVSGMADETFGISVIEAQASGLPVVGVAAGAMVDRVRCHRTGRLGPVDDAPAMARNIADLLGRDQAALQAAAVAEARHYGWDRSMDKLFDDLYPQAHRRAALRARAAVAAEPALAEA